MSAKSEAPELTEIVAKIVDKRREQIRINPTWVATEALMEIDPEKTAPALVAIGCHLQLRQIARSICRDLFEEAERDDFKDSLFPELQWRYPQRHRRDEEPSYVLRDHMSDDDITFNVARLRSEAQAKLDHADALEAWASSRRRTVA